MDVSSPRGVEVSRHPCWPELPHVAREPDNRYALAPEVGPESVDLLVDEDLFTERYGPVLLQAWYFALAPGGVARVRRHESPAAFRARFPAAAAKFAVARDGAHLTLTKGRPALRPGDTIDRWSFGIPTNHARPEWLERCIDAIEAQGIPEFEVILCGTYNGPLRPGVRFIDFKERDDLGWITRKKNLLCAAARYDNLAILHDRIVLDPGWFAGMKRYGNYFEALGCAVVNAAGGREADWVTWGSPLWIGSRQGLLAHDDWDPFVYLDGAFCALKRSVWEAHPWDEDYYWREGEDVALSHAMTRAGVVIRFNPDARCLSLASKAPLPLHPRDPSLRGPRPVPAGPYSARHLRDDGARAGIAALRALGLYRPVKELAARLRRRA